MTLNVSFLSNNNNQKNIKNNTKPNKNSNIKKIAEYTLLATTTAFGLYYFAKHQNLKKIVEESKKASSGIKDVQISKPAFNTTSSSGEMIFTEGNATVYEKPKWNALVTGFCSSPTQKPYKTPVKKEIPAAGQILQDIIPSSKIKEISTEIKQYMLRSGIDSKNKKINPEAIDEILTKILGEKNIKERPFKPAECMSKGRVKEYTAPNGRIYVLEVHLHKDEGYVTRLYLTHRDRDLRAYLHPDGTFRLNSYAMRTAHFETTAKGKRWMENSPFLVGSK